MERFKAPPEAIDLHYFLKPRNISSAPKELPSMYCCLGVNPAADGSAYFEYGNIKILGSVSGPTEMKQEGQLTTSFKFAPFASQIRKDGVRDSEEKRLSQLLLSALEPSIALHTFPRGKYQISVLVLDDGGVSSCQAPSACLSAGITCASLALVHAGVQMYDMVVALSSTSLETDSSCNIASFSIAVMPQLAQITMVNSTGLAHGPTLTSSLRAILQGVLEKAKHMHALILSFLSSSLEEDKGSPE
uniref:Exoribonuclease phosphorolytic domain-containing protein n=1 Tax=Schistocephalus solidus TaxID=70667 RepID=A0A0V0J1I8_SCHSO